jgi:hypothetical protein
MLFFCMSLLAAALALGTAAPAVAQAAATAARAPPDAATAFAERSALLHAMDRCPMMADEELAALAAGAAQARSALLRGGWTAERIAALRSRAIVAVDARACNDPALRQSVAQAQAGFAAWARLPAMQFPGQSAAWSAARIPDADGWYLRQPGRFGSILGVREGEDGPVVALAAPLTANSPEPAFGILSFRDAARAPESLIGVPGRSRHGLAAVSASPAMSRQVWARGRDVMRTEDGRRLAILTFPMNAFDGVEALDPREAIEVRLGRTEGETGARLYFEVGDLVAARVFLAARPTP